MFIRTLIKSQKGKLHCRNPIEIEIPIVKLQKNRGGIMSTDVVFGINQDRQIWELQRRIIGSQ
jgi:hypothetical protein